MLHTHLKWVRPQGTAGMPSLVLVFLLSSCSKASVPDKPSPPVQKQEKSREAPVGGNVTSSAEPSKRAIYEPITQTEVNNSTAYLLRRTESGKQNAKIANNKKSTALLGVTGTGKSTTANYWIGCDMALRTPEELEALGIQQEEAGLEDVIIVEPDSERPEAASIGHGMVSHTLIPQIIQDPHCNTRVYIDCPGFSDNRGAAVNIANAINIRQVLQQAMGVNVVFLAKYQHLLNRALGIQNLENTCQQMFGSVDNLRRYQNSVLLGINRAPAQTSIQSVRATLAQMGSIAEILAPRAFLYDPLERGGADFWSREQFLTEIAQLDSIPQREATTLFQTVLTGDDRTMLQHIVEHQVEALNSVLEQGDYPAAVRCWNLLNQLRIIEHQEIEELMREQVRPHMRNYAAGRITTFSRYAAQHQFTEAEQILISLRSLNEHFPDEGLVDLEDLEATLQTARAQYTAQQEAEEARRVEAEARHRAEEELDRERRKRKAMEERLRRREAEVEAVRRQNQTRTKSD